MSDVGIQSDVLPKKSRKSYKEPDLDEFDDDEEDDVADTKPSGVDAENDDDEEGEDLDEDEFVVEKIFSHYIAEDVCLAIPSSLFDVAHV